MAPRSTTNKAKAAGIGASSFLDLKAELTAKEKEITENKGSGKKTSSGGLKPGKVSGLHYLLFGDGDVHAFAFSSVTWSRNQRCGLDLIRALTREPREISNLKPSNDQQSKPRTRFWNASRGYTSNLTKGGVLA